MYQKLSSLDLINNYVATHIKNILKISYGNYC